jgi:hypothetical protein
LYATFNLNNHYFVINMTSTNTKRLDILINS